MSVPDLQTWFRVQQFLSLESRLLDERRFDEWLSLYAPDAQYWVPGAWRQESPTGHVSLFYENVELLRMRIDRLQRGLSPLDWPHARTTRHVTDVTVEAGTDGELQAAAKVLIVEYRREEQRLLSGHATWRLRSRGEGFEIALKRLDLLNADQDTGHLRFSAPL